MIVKSNLGIKASGESKVGPLLWERGREWRITQLSAIFSTYGDEGIKTSNPKCMPSLAMDMGGGVIICAACGC